MRLFTKGKSIAVSLLAKGKVKNTHDAARFFGYYVIPLTLFFVAEGYLSYRHSAVFTSNQDERMEITLLFVVSILFFQLIKITAAKKQPSGSCGPVSLDSINSITRASWDCCLHG
jgi:hypothetical protein